MTEANPYLIDRLLAVQDQVLAAYAQLDPKAPEHAMDLRKVLIEQFLRPLFSAHRRFTSGRITDAMGVLTEQIDLTLLLLVTILIRTTTCGFGTAGERCQSSDDRTLANLFADQIESSHLDFHSLSQFHSRS